MTTVVFYDLNSISDRDVARATTLAGPDAIHSLPSDALWSAQDRVARLRLPSMRDQATRARTLQQMWDLLDVLTDANYRGVDLRDVTRFNLLFSLERTFYVAWVLSRLRAEFTGTVDWHTDCPESAKTLEGLGNQSEFALRVHTAAIRRDTIVHNWLQAARTRAWKLRREWQERRWNQAVPTAVGADCRRPIVFTEYYPNSARVTLAIAQHLREHSQARSVFVSSRLEVARTAEAAEMPAALLRTFPRAKDWRARRRLLAENWKLQLARLRDEPIQLVPGGPDCRRIILPALEREVVRAFTEAAALADDAHAMIDKLAPACLATTTSGSTFGRTMTAVASARGVATAWIQHGLSTDDPTFMHMAYDALLVWGEYDRRRYLEADVHGAIEVVGAPHYEALARRARELPCNPTPLADRREVSVLFLASRTGGATVTSAAAERLIRELTTAVLAIPNAVLTIKTHPGDRTKLAERLTASLDRVRVVEHGPASEMIPKCDVAVVTSSTAGLEACIVKKPLISFAYDGMPTGVDYAGYGAAYCAKNEQELAAALQTLWSGDGAQRLREGQQRLVDDMLGGADGNALDRAAEILLRLANSSTAQGVR